MWSRSLKVARMGKTRLVIKVTINQTLAFMTFTTSKTITTLSPLFPLVATTSKSAHYSNASPAVRTTHGWGNTRDSLWPICNQRCVFSHVFHSQSTCFHLHILGENFLKKQKQKFEVGLQWMQTKISGLNSSRTGKCRWKIQAIMVGKVV